MAKRSEEHQQQRPHSDRNHSSSSNAEEARRPFNFYPIEYYSPGGVDAFFADRARRAPGVLPLSAGAMPDASGISRTRHVTPVVIQPPPSSMTEPRFLAFRVGLRASAVVLSVAVVVLTVLDGVFLPKGTSWDLFWDIFFVPVLFFNALILLALTHRLLHPALPPQRRLAHGLTILGDVVSFIGFVIFSVLDGVCVIKPEWHFTGATGLENLAQGNGDDIWGLKSESESSKRKDKRYAENQHGGRDPAVTSFIVLSTLTPSASIMTPTSTNERSNLFRSDIPSTPAATLAASQYARWNAIAIAASIIAGLLALLHLACLVLEILESRHTRRHVRLGFRRRRLGGGTVASHSGEPAMREELGQQQRQQQDNDFLALLQNASASRLDSQRSTQEFVNEQQRLRRMRSDKGKERAQDFDVDGDSVPYRFPGGGQASQHDVVHSVSPIDVDFSTGKFMPPSTCT